MKRRVVWGILFALVVVVALSFSMTTTDADILKAVVCHKRGHPPDVKEPITLEVGLEAAQAHIAHGDYSGACN